MVFKKNVQLMKKYLDYRLHVDQITKGSAGREAAHMRHVIHWAGDTSFKKAADIRPTFPEYLQSNTISERKKELSPVYIKKALATARNFFTWLSENEAGYKHIKQAWIKKIKVRRLAEIPRTTEYVTLDEILTIARRPCASARTRRARAGLVFLFLSGMRIGAFISLPLRAVDIPNRTIYQYPSLGVRTKNNKHGKTFLLDIPELLQVVQEWDNEIRAILPPDGFWFAHLSPQTGEIDPSITEAGNHRFNLARRDFQKWLDREGLPYHSPHKFRHGHIHYGMGHARTAADMKAVSLNVMHSDIKTTDQFYSSFDGEELKQRVTALNKNGGNEDKQNIIKALEDALRQLKDA
ncbi:MAG: tyrosine-type recombinase/integrase [Anaerolineales bacterium]|jgi:integrase|nr:MAG: tyrosine-type recombinase/integrase [Anaerolineales bacterium]